MHNAIKHVLVWLHVHVHWLCIANVHVHVAIPIHAVASNVRIGPLLLNELIGSGSCIVSPCTCVPKYIYDSM